MKLKKDREWYSDIHSQVLQDMVKRVDLAFERYLKGDGHGKRSGKPRFKGKHRYRTFTYSQGKAIKVNGNKAKLPKIGEVKVIFHRPLPEGFTIKTVAITQKADGYHITFSLSDKTVPEVTSELKPTLKNSIGIDVGLEKFLTTSNGVLIEPPKYLRKSEDKLGKLQQKALSRPQGSQGRKQLFKKVARLHQKIARQRKDFHFNTAKKLLNMADCIFIEDLNISNMTRRCKPKVDENGRFIPNGQSRKSGLNKSFYDAGIGDFLNRLQNKAEKAGLKVIKVNPSGTSQYCSNCLNRVSKTLSDRWHCCSKCGTIIDRDLNSAELIKKVGLGIASLKKARTSKVA